MFTELPIVVSAAITIGLRRELILFAFRNWDDRLVKAKWMDNLELHKKMISIFSFCPIDNFVTGKYADEFWAWENDRRALKKIAKS